MSSKFVFFLALTNIFIVNTFFFIRWNLLILDRSHIVEKLVVSGLTIFMLALTFLFLKGGLRKTVALLNLNFLLFVILVACAQVVFSTFPALLPKALLDFAPQLSPELAKTRLDVLEYLDESPWVKFKPNIEVDIKPISNRGDDFEYSWRTDSLGFKNQTSLVDYGEFAAVAIGDSSVEAMGVPTDKIWSSLLTDRGFATYNLGVQGYSPQQITDSLKKYGRKFKTKYVIYGYTVGFEQRTLHFADFKNGKNITYTGAIEAVNEFAKERRIVADRPFDVINATIDFYENVLAKNLLFGPSKKSSAELAQFYVEQIKKTKKEFSEDDPAWQLTRDSIVEGRKIARAMGARPVLLIFRDRDYIYYEKLLKKPAPVDNLEAAIVSAVVEFAQDNAIDVVDTYSGLKNYVDGLSDPIDVSLLPYFKVDGHLNEIGQEIVAQTLADYFKQNR